MLSRTPDRPKKPALGGDEQVLMHSVDACSGTLASYSPRLQRVLVELIFTGDVNRQWIELTPEEMDEIARAWLRYRIGADTEGQVN